MTMAAHCPVCNSTDITPMVSPKGIHYYQCNNPECLSKFVTPVYDPFLAETPAPSSEEDAS